MFLRIKFSSKDFEFCRKFCLTFNKLTRTEIPRGSPETKHSYFLSFRVLKILLRQLVVIDQCHEIMSDACEEVHVKTAPELAASLPVLFL